MKRIINITPQSSTAGHGADDWHHQPAQTKSAAGIDTEIFNADPLGLDGERFWEAYWRTQHIYGGLHEGKPLEAVFSSLDNAIFEKLCHDIERVSSNLVKIDEAEQNDILGMVVFLLGMEKNDPDYNPAEHDGYEAALAHFSSLMHDESQRRTEGGSP
ncbi:MAG TPA: hypothetical protein PLI90_10880 [Rhodocyclaceae bacterium]|nr:hypothetical protein [Rhodocyclaceae bacterium]